MADIEKMGVTADHSSGEVEDSQIFNHQAVKEETAHEAAERGRLATDM
jgi:hypothetical protein